MGDIADDTRDMANELGENIKYPPKDNFEFSEGMEIKDNDSNWIVIK